MQPGIPQPVRNRSSPAQPDPGTFLPKGVGSWAPLILLELVPKISAGDTSGKNCASRWGKATAPCSATFAMRSATSTGIGWSRTPRSSPPVARCSAMSRRATTKHFKHHYTSGPPKDWPSHYISSYATMHPWEDWAESWAHYLHMMDTLETAGGLGMVLRPQAIDGDRPKAVTFRALHTQDFDALMKAWVPLTLSLNSLNRSMGQIDSYPFVLSDDATEKLRSFTT